MERHSTKSTIAWFKLAEFVGRKEKERAFVMYRLLTYGLNDPAFIAQLEGDLLAAFKDDRASEAYGRSLLLYEASGRLQDALFVGERLCALAPEPSAEMVLKIAELSYQLGYHKQPARQTLVVSEATPFASKKGMTTTQSFSNSP